MLWELDQLFLKKDFKLPKWCLGPIQTHLEAFLGFLGKTKMKLRQNLDLDKTVVLSCPIVDRKSVAASSGDLQWQPAPR